MSNADDRRSPRRMRPGANLRPLATAAGVFVVVAAGCMLKSQYGWWFNESTQEPWPTWQLYAHVHVQCESDIEYIGKAEFYAENGDGNSPITLETRPISCQGDRFEELEEGFQTIDEIPIDVK